MKTLVDFEKVLKEVQSGEMAGKRRCCFVDESRFEQAPLRAQATRWSKSGIRWTFNNFKTTRSPSLNAVSFVSCDGDGFSYTMADDLDSKGFTRIIKDVINRNKKEHGFPITFITDSARIHSKEELEALDKSESTTFVYIPKYCP